MFFKTSSLSLRSCSHSLNFFDIKTTVVCKSLRWFLNLICFFLFISDIEFVCIECFLEFNKIATYSRNFKPLVNTSSGMLLTLLLSELPSFSFFGPSPSVKLLLKSINFELKEKSLTQLSLLQQLLCDVIVPLSLERARTPGLTIRKMV